MGKTFKRVNLLGIANLLKSNLASENDKKYLLLFAHNGVGKTRLSMLFKDIVKKNNNKNTLYYNAFTEDLFTWENDLDLDTTRYLNFNSSSIFFTAFTASEVESRITQYYRKYTEIEFDIDYAKSIIKFKKRKTQSTQDTIGQYDEYIKISRGEENMFIWCVFIAFCSLAIEGDDAYAWVKYIYIDDPISSLDENNAILVAVELARLLKLPQNKIKFVISTHHTLFYNVMANELTKTHKYFLSYIESENKYSLSNIGDMPFFHHVVLVSELQKVIKSNKIYNFHFNILRTLLEKSANFHGFSKFSDCLDIGQSNEEIALHSRYVNLLSHGGYTMFDAKELNAENKRHFKNIFNNFISKYPFNEEIFN